MTELVVQTPANPTAMLTALESLAGRGVKELRFAVAYATLPGCETLIPRLIDRIGERRWRSISKTAILTTDFHMTEPRALQYLVSTGFATRLSDLPACNYHPKLYAFLSDGSIDALVGSANLTLAALSDNVEAATCSPLRDRRVFASVWTDLLGHSKELTRSTLQAYREARRHMPPPLSPDRRPARAARPAAGQLTVFRDVVEGGAVQAAGFASLWVEVGTPSGGSGNQIELPRGAHRFFGFSGGGTAARHLIGTPKLVSGGYEWSDRKLTWHGQGAMNQMERLNLPTVRQGGFRYAGMMVLFTRRGSAFQLTVARSGSAVAESWRRASQQAGREYRLGKQNSRRRCGLF